ncbi:Lpp/OprI family alanine-zipper lipoprotein [Vibrio sp. SS-MA-C1-2]|uniref:Lpp/OprI family alanine-zipper lipoprotein n=1 Tax=Vibrio sp. SS-MA-C1-2 TaxID=2908646 RepID=UPI001F2FFF9B|nr:Lpp/OprI family alanine-zipper lipoprotein [Vibrio sp. SS-MA-C1-2]UJF17398.1 Lpp/OprI family alanine-zipper lipoprotein [Vibrio sp. SS-MA-C1-2]
MNKKLIATAIVATAFLGGCADNTQLQQSVNILTNKVDQLSAEVAALKSDVKESKMATMDARQEAERANARIDNVASSYKK